MTTHELTGWGRDVSQDEALDSRQVPNHAGGYVYAVDPLEACRRFLILGTAGGTYYVDQRAHTRESLDALTGVIAAGRAAELVALAVEISEAGRAPRNDQALFVLALCAAVDDVAVRRAALDALPRVARTSTHLFMFLTFVRQFRGWGRGLRTAVAGWYLDKDVADLAYQAVKYRQRDGWTHRDVLRVSHPKTVSSETPRSRLFDWICGRLNGPDADLVGLGLPPVVVAYAALERDRYLAENGVDGVADHVLDTIDWSFSVGQAIPWEAVPDVFRTRATWERLLDRRMVPLGALVRQLPTLTRLGVLAPLQGAEGRTAAVCARLVDPVELRQARLHPLALLSAARTYAAGRSLRGSAEWDPVGEIEDALEAGFVAAFGVVEPAVRRTLLALDVSGSMDMDTVAGLAGVTPREGAAAMALVTAVTEPSGYTSTVAFTSDRGYGSGHTALTPLPSLRTGATLGDALRATHGLTFGATDCALPMLWAAERKLPVDTFVVYTDNETWAGAVHPVEALRRYRASSGLDSRLVVVGMTATDFTIADPSDRGMLDVVGFDAGAPALLSAFSRGEL